MLSKFSETTNDKNLSNICSKIDIVVGVDHGQGTFRSVGKFIMRDKEGINKDSYVIKHCHIDWTKDTYEIFQKILATPISNDLEYLMREGYCLYIKWKKDGNLVVSYETKDNESLNNYISYISIPTRILISGDLVFFATIVGKNNMSGHWCHWCMLSPLEWENCDHDKGNKWSIQLIKDNLKKQFSNLDMTPYDKKGSVLPILFDTIPIENYIFSLLHAEIGIGNKIISSFYTWITTYIERLLVEEKEMRKTLIVLQIELINDGKKIK